MLWEKEELQYAICGACMVDYRAVFELIKILPSEKYFTGDFKKVYKIILNLHRDQKSIDSIMVSEEAIKVNVNPSFIFDCTNRVASSKHIIDHAGLLKKYWLIDKLRSDLTEQVAKLARGEDPDEVASSLTKVLISAREEDSTSVQTAEDAVASLLDKAKRVADRGGKMAGKRFTALEEFDAIFSGIEEGDVIMIGASPKVGKSSIMNNVLVYSIENKIPTYASSGEMPNPKSAARLIAGLSRVATRSIEKGEFYKEGMVKMMENVDSAVEQVKGLPIFLSDAPLSISGVIADINYYFNRHGVRRFLFDRIGLFQEVVSAEKNDAKMRDVVMASLRRIANTMGLEIIIYSQLTKDALKHEGKRPQGQDLFGGTGGPANCTKAALLYRPSAFDLEEFEAGPYKGCPAKGYCEIFTVYNNSDELRSCKVRFDGERQIFVPDSDLLMDIEEEDAPIKFPNKLDEAELPF